MQGKGRRTAASPRNSRMRRWVHLVRFLLGAISVSVVSLFALACSAEPDYVSITDGTGALSFEVPPWWNERDIGEASETKGDTWSEVAKESIDSSITASSDLQTWYRGGRAPGIYAVASKKLAREHSDEELVASGPNDVRYHRCVAEGAQDFDARAGYLGKQQAWTECGLEGHKYEILTLAVAPEGRECVMLMLAPMFEPEDHAAVQRILDTFEVDCERAS